MYVCVCQAVSDQDIRSAVTRGARTFEDVRTCTGCTTSCGCCEAEARKLVEASLQSEGRIATLPVAA